MLNVPCATFTVVGRCAETGDLGVATSTAIPAGGAICPFIEPGVGAVTSQSFNNYYLALALLDSLRTGRRCEDAIASNLAGDPNRALRQVAVVSIDGTSAAFTGEDCVAYCGQRLGPDYAVAGNMLVGPETLDAMEKVFTETHASMDLPERLLRALEAGQANGGDKRGKQSAALKVYGKEAFARCDLRVDEHSDPVRELRRVFEVAKVQLFPYLKTMPTRQDPAGNLTRAVLDIVSLSVSERPTGQD